MNQPRIIKRHANRRLYDTEARKHVTLKDIRQMIVEGIDVRIVDGSSDQDITHALLLQIIQEREKNGPALLTGPLLCQLIRFYDNPFQQMMSDYLHQSVSTFLAQQQLYHSQMQKMMAVAPLEIMQELMLQNMKNWEQWLGKERNAADESSSPK